jgi:uncharacterized damage-inducible protein DinB
MSTMTITEMRAASRLRSANDFPGTIRSQFPYWDGQFRPYLLLALDALPADRFDYKPQPSMLTAHQTLLHIAEAEHSWMNIVGGKKDEEWVVELPNGEGYKTIIDAPDHAAVRALLEKSHARVQEWLDRPVAELGKVITYRAHDGVERQYTIHWMLDHLQEHEIHHRAQLNMYLRMMGITPPSI